MPALSFSHKTGTSPTKKSRLKYTCFKVAFQPASKFAFCNLLQIILHRLLSQPLHHLHQLLHLCFPLRQPRLLLHPRCRRMG